jgi:predicted small integral membrane protein
VLAVVIVFFAVAGAALVALVWRGLVFRPRPLWWVCAITSAGTMAFGALAIAVGLLGKTHVVTADGQRHGLGGPGPLIALVFGVVLFLLAALAAWLLYRGLPRARLIAAQLAAEEAELRKTFAQLPGG